MRQGGGGNRTERRGAFHTPHWVWKGRRVQTQSSLCALCYAGEKREGTDGKSKWLDHWKLEKQDKCHYQFRLSCFLTFIYSRWGFSRPLMFVRWLMSVCAQSNQNQQLKMNTNYKWYFCVLFSGFWSESQPHEAEMPIYFLVGSLGKTVTPRLANTKIDRYPSVFFFLLHLPHTVLVPITHINLWENWYKKKNWVTNIRNRTATQKNTTENLRLLWHWGKLFKSLQRRKTSGMWRQVTSNWIDWSHSPLPAHLTSKICLTDGS